MKTITVNPRSFGRYVGYLSNGLNIDEANDICKKTLGIGSWTLEQWFVEPNPKRRFHKPELEKALDMCVERNATLIIPKVQHLVHNTVFVELCFRAQFKVAQLKVKDKKLDILGCDLMGSEPMQMGLLYNLALAKSEKTSKSVKKKMKELKEQGVKLGAPDLSIARAHSSAALRARAKERRVKILPIIKEIQKDGNRTLQDIARQLNKRGVPTARGGKWYATSVKNILRK
jgi:DNA invertase Pin-like site-specific DNA recombinase